MAARPLTSSSARPGFAGCLSTSKETARPTIISASSASVAAFGSRSPTTLPARSTLIRSATSITSCSLWVMNTSALPASRSDRTMPKNSVTSCGVSTAVGSSKMSTLAERNSTLMISTRCWMPTGISSMMALGSTLSPCWALIVRHLLARLGEVETVERAHRLDAEHDVFGDREHRHQHEVLMHHADAGADGVAGAVEAGRLAVDEDLALVRPVEAGEHVHQRRLAGAVLAQEAENLARADVRLMESLATRSPKRLVMPRSSMSKLQHPRISVGLAPGSR